MNGIIDHTDYAKAGSAKVMTPAEIRAAAPSVFATRPYGAMSPRYRFVPTFDVIDMLADQGFRPVYARESSSRVEKKAGFGRHMVKFRHDDYLPIVGESVPEVVLFNAHDGSGALEFVSGRFRFLCENSAIVCDG